MTQVHRPQAARNAFNVMMPFWLLQRRVETRRAETGGKINARSGFFQGYYWLCPVMEKGVQVFRNSVDFYTSPGDHRTLDFTINYRYYSATKNLLPISRNTSLHNKRYSLVEGAELDVFLRHHPCQFSTKSFHEYELLNISNIGQNIKSF